MPTLFATLIGALLAVQPGPPVLPGTPPAPLVPKRVPPKLEYEAACRLVDSAGSLSHLGLRITEGRSRTGVINNVSPSLSRLRGRAYVVTSSGDIDWSDAWTMSDELDYIDGNKVLALQIKMEEKLPRALIIIIDKNESADIPKYSGMCRVKFR